MNVSGSQSYRNEHLKLGQVGSSKDKHRSWNDYSVSLWIPVNRYMYDGKQWRPSWNTTLDGIS